PFIHNVLGEWGAAISYDGIEQRLPTGQHVMWLSPQFRDPPWTSNSGFSVLTPLAPPTDCDADGLDDGFSRVTNGSVEIRIDYSVQRQAGAPIRMGLAEHGFGSAAPYYLRQIYTITNVTGSVLTNVRLYQFLHAHPANARVAPAFVAHDATDFG